MNIRTTGILLVIIGAVLFAYEGVIKYRTRDRIIDAGPVHVSAEVTHHISYPPVVAAVALIGGVVMLIGSAKQA
jgi:uncharacterized membrane protein YidH (DUF202 family)